MPSLSLDQKNQLFLCRSRVLGNSRSTHSLYFPTVQTSTANIMSWSPADLPLPAVLDPVLEYVKSHLPPPLYDLLLAFLSHILALLTAFVALVSPLLSTNPWEWDPQTVLPPLISLLAAYLALVSLYRTTAWAIRTSMWFVKWGAILAILMGGTGWIIGASKAVMSPGANGVLSGIRDVVLDTINVGSATGSRRSRTRRKGSQSPPKPWESFDRHRAWRERQQGPQETDQQGDALKYVADIVDAAGRAAGGTAWWEVVKSVVDGAGKSGEGEEGKGSRTRQGKTTSATGKSTRPR